MLLILMAVAGCAHRQDPQSFHRAAPSQPDAHEGVVVHKIMTPGSRGSAVRVGDTELWTCLHLLTQPVLLVDGLPTGYEILEQGQGTSAQDDWAIISVDDEVLAPCGDLSYLEHDLQVIDGQEVWLKGYWSAGPLTHSQAIALENSMVPARVESPPRPIEASDELIYVVAPSNETYLGGSGCATVGYLDDRQILLGMYVEADTYLTLSGLHVRHLCRRWPVMHSDPR